MGRRDLSGDDRPWGKAPGERACTGVRQDTPESDTIIKSREGHFRKAAWESTENMTLPEKEPYLTPVLSSSGLLLFWDSVPTVSGGIQDNQLPHRDQQGLSHTFPRITLPSWWDLMYTAAGGTSADLTIPFRSHSRPWSSPTQSRAPSPPPGSDLSLRSEG